MAGDTPQHEDDKLRLAGMALRNGVLVIGPTHWAAAVRRPDGTVEHASRPRRLLHTEATDRFPLLRGPVRLAEMLLVLPQLRQALPSARFSFESPAVVGSTLLGAVATSLIRRRLGKGFVSELAGSATSLAMLLGMLRGGEVAQYHGAEHKVIGGYELDIPASEATREHGRCGTHLAVPMLLANAAATQGAMLLLPGAPGLARALGAGAGLAASTELARAMQLKQSHWLTALASSVGMGLQSVASTSEPTPEQLAVAQRALDALLEAERLST